MSKCENYYPESDQGCGERVDDDGAGRLIAAILAERNATRIAEEFQSVVSAGAGRRHQRTLYVHHVDGEDDARVGRIGVDQPPFAVERAAVVASLIVIQQTGRGDVADGRVSAQITSAVFVGKNRSNRK